MFAQNTKYSGGNILQRFRRSNSGSFAILFTLALIPLMGIIGMGVEFGQAVIARSKLQHIADSAALAAGREFQVNGDVSAAEARAVSFYNSAVATMMSNGNRYDIPSPSITVDEMTGTMTINAAGTMNTAFLRVIHMDQIEFSTRTEAVLKIGNNNESIEVAMMLDVTGSMGGSKIQDMKEAAKDVIEILVANDQVHHTSRVALAPFSRTVNVGSNYFKKVTNKKVKNGVTCVTERTSNQRYTDFAPGNGHWLKKYKNGSCAPNSTIVPLTDDKTLLNATIDSFNASGMTAGHLGTAWAWYLVSPKWNNIWPADSQATPYNQDNSIKAVILMTDGQYNQVYSNNGSSDHQARQLCANMKDEGVVVYTVGFELTASNAIETMQQCASSTSHYYLAEDGDELKLAFRDIAFKLAQLRLSQ